MVMKKIVLLSRKSFLAKIQTHIAEIEINKIQKNIIDTHYSSSVGDTDMSAKAWEQHGFGIFTNSLSKKLILKDADVVVHSFKDLPVKNLNKTSFICLKRDDPRDVILIKKTSLNKKKLVIGTSSPRRKYYLKKLRKFLPFEELKPFDIRGNVPSRLEKILNSSKEDGVFMAKAAIDRIFKYGEKINKKDYRNFKLKFKKFEKIILPISEFPSAAAQGCIALEYRRDDRKTEKILKKINHLPSLDDCQRERKYLYKWGGGCNLDVGVTIENIVNEKILFAQGKDNQTKKYFKEKKYLNNKKVKKVKNIFPSSLSKYQMFQRNLHEFNKTVKNKNVLVTRSEFKEFKSLKSVSNLITSGVSSWKKISKMGILVNSSLDSFGENYRETENFYKDNQKPTYKLTYEGNMLNKKFPVISHYSLVPLINDNTIDNLFVAESFYWMSFSAFKLAIQLRPEILNKRNSCGPGQTYLQISKFIPKNQLNVYLTYDDFKNFELK